jgi:N-acetylglucosamine-6-phosphate deacetylase
MIEQPVGRFALTNARIVFSDRIVRDKAIIIENDQVVGIADSGAIGSDIAQVDVGGRTITPGLIDIHTHGALGHTFNEPTADAFAAITRENARRGVTALLATIATAPIDNLARSFEFTRAWMRTEHAGTQILGAHLESPYISPAQRGALDPANIRTPDDGSVEALLEYADALKIFVLAPELPGALDLVAQLARRGIIPAAGHTMARDEQVLAAMRVGLRHVTHIWSAMSTTIREGPWRKPGVLETALAYDGLTVEMICDNKHLPYLLNKLG